MALTAVRSQPNLRVWSDGQVLVAPVGTTAPTTLSTAWVAAWKDLGWIAASGVVESHSVDDSQIRSWQAGTLLRVIKSNDTRTFQFSALESNFVTQGLARPGATTSTTTGVTTTVVKPFVASDVRAFGFDFLDGSIEKRIIVANGEVTAFGDYEYTSTDQVTIDFTVTAYPDSNGVLYTEISNEVGLTSS